MYFKATLNFEAKKIKYLFYIQIVPQHLIIGVTIISFNVSSIEVLSTNVK